MIFQTTSVLGILKHFQESIMLEKRAGRNNHSITIGTTMILEFNNYRYMQTIKSNDCNNNSQNLQSCGMGVQLMAIAAPRINY